MATESIKTEPVENKPTFICKYCKQEKSFDEMVVVTEYFPPIVVCKVCAGNIRI
ncbi:MAG: hypothetical protein JW712_10255 [Dehalococcoidales bacterium]|nr:hypothetical protein [Dehalococcoidales bacterium]